MKIKIVCLIIQVTSFAIFVFLVLMSLYGNNLNNDQRLDRLIISIPFGLVSTVLMVYLSRWLKRFSKNKIQISVKSPN